MLYLIRSPFARCSGRTQQRVLSTSSITLLAASSTHYSSCGVFRVTDIGPEGPAHYLFPDALWLLCRSQWYVHPFSTFYRNLFSAASDMCDYYYFQWRRADLCWTKLYVLRIHHVSLSSNPTASQCVQILLHSSLLCRYRFYHQVKAPPPPSPNWWFQVACRVPVDLSTRGLFTFTRLPRFVTVGGVTQFHKLPWRMSTRDYCNVSPTVSSAVSIGVSLILLRHSLMHPHTLNWRECRFHCCINHNFNSCR